MPVDFEPLYSASPPLFKSYVHHMYRYAPGSTYTATSTTDRFVANRLSSTTRKVPFAYPLRPILIVRPAECVHQQNGASATTTTTTPDDEEIEYESTSSPTSPVGDVPPPTSSVIRTASSKKRVVFADDRGMALEHVKVMTEPSDCPPRWQDEFFEHVTQGATAAVAADRWEPVFAQPASDYVEFRRKLERDCVCLENVITKETDESVVGTVKVKNLSFDKRVFVRVSFDRWNSHEDHDCSYVPSGTEGTSLYDLYDTFQFTFAIPHGAAKFGCVEFCVAYRLGDDREFWDNNGGVNYKLQALSANGKSGALTAHPLKFDDAFTARLNTWTEFASWNHLNNDTPYW